ncbi:3-phosphoserine/phosphohydroxythreonine transaminase [Capsulimonas sp.]|uniref:3-phosphoserine/phosphohydroxythreonine transaminase n=2 Tax=Capsulimonas sp. TaxID=2494211 RepID=UPI0032665CDD
MMSHRIYNFSAGPAILPEAVLEEAAQGVREINGSGMSLLEVSHRGKDYEAIHNDAEQRLLRVLGVSADEYVPMFLQGGASGQFAQLPLNFLSAGQHADYIIGGDWGAKALKEAKNLGDAREIASSKADKYTYIPKQFTVSPAARYVHITTNNTIEGTEYFDLPDVGDIPLVADSSSDFTAVQRDNSKFAMIYAGAQKNAGPAGVTIVVAKKSFLDTARTDIPAIWAYKTHRDTNSLYNTPPTFAIYVVGLVLKWIEAEGGQAAIEARNKAKAAILYNALDELSGVYEPAVTVKEDRSLMNVTWRLRNPALEAEFLAEAKAAKLDGLKGHRSVGGFRASIYNAFPTAGVQALADLLRDFAQRKG